MSAAEKTQAVEEGPRLAAGERRRSERTETACDGWISGPGGNDFTSGRQVRVVDLSLHGVGFISDRACEPDERRWVLIHRGALRLSTRVRVASCRQRGDGMFDVGGEFY